MKILITGAGGFVGKELTSHFSAQHQVLALTHTALDISDEVATKRVIKDAGPDLIINCSVFGVDDCEQNPVLGRAVNALGPQYLAEAAAEIDAEILQLSTNY